MASPSEPASLICAEVWGGNETANRRVDIPGMHGAVYASPAGTGKGGDVYYATACSAGMTARFCLADVAGHGDAVVNVSTWLHEVLHNRINLSDPSKILAALNKVCVERGLDALASAACFSYYAPTGVLQFAYAGHPPAFVRMRGCESWEKLELPAAGSGPRNVLLAVTDEAQFDLGERTIQPGTRVAVYSDGVFEAANPEGEQFGMERLQASLAEWNGLDCADVPMRVAESLRAFTGDEALAHDDVTLLAFEAGQRMRAPAPYYLILNNFRKLARGALS